MKKLSLVIFYLIFGILITPTFGTDPPPATPQDIRVESLPDSTSGATSAAISGGEPVKLGFGVGDINLPQGSVTLSKTDLVIPGKNGMDVVIERNYDSSRYREKIGEFGPATGMGRGWRLNLGMKAFVSMYNSNNSLMKYYAITIQSSNGLETFLWNVQEQRFISKRPNSKATVAFIYDNQVRSTAPAINYEGSGRGRIEMRAENGSLYTFALTCFVEKIAKNTRNDLFLLTYGYDLTSVQDVNGQTVGYDYDNLGGGDYQEFANENEGFKYTLPDILNESYTLWNQDTTSTPYSIYNRVIKRQHRLRKITDTWNNEINLNYIVNSTGTDENRFRVGDISYRNHEGVLKRIRYYNDITHYLIAVRIDGLPDETYTYQDYVPSYIWKGQGDMQWHYLGWLNLFSNDPYEEPLTSGPVIMLPDALGGLRPGRLILTPQQEFIDYP